MNNDKMKRLRYYKGQLLTKQDFEDQQSYHLEKLRRHMRRFPFGIVDGLRVEYDQTISKLKITGGMAVDNEWKELYVPDEGKDKLKANTTVDDGVNGAVRVHTSCSKPIEIGDVHGAYTITDLVKTFD